jgi:hypothetical protein
LVGSDDPCNSEAEIELPGKRPGQLDLKARRVVLAARERQGIGMSTDCDDATGSDGLECTGSNRLLQEDG